jgi:hypothetical protein
MSRKWLLLRLLKDAGSVGATTADLLAAGVGSRYGARLLELRDHGYVIESRRERQSSFRYILTDEPGVEAPAGRQLTPRPGESEALQPSCGCLSAELTLFEQQIEKAKPTPHWKAA